MEASIPSPFRLRLFAEDAPGTETAAETGGGPPRRRTGPVMMGDIHAQAGGTPLLLLLWDRWTEEAPDD